nr:uncharacterized protein LOC109155208 [Ipomoea batatas]
MEFSWILGILRRGGCRWIFGREWRRRPLIGVDGCHLKGNQKGGQLLSAVGIDANNNMYPITFTVVEGELKETWKWLLELLDGDLHISQNLTDGPLCP